MTGRTGALTNETPTISASDAARIAAEEALHVQWQQRAARVIAAQARDLADCRMLLDIIGLDTTVLAAARTDRTAALATEAAPLAGPVARSRARSTRPAGTRPTRAA